MNKPKNVSEPWGPIVGVNGFPLGEGVYKPLSEILHHEGAQVKPKIDNLSKKRYLSSYNETYRSTSSCSTSSVTEDTDGSDLDAPAATVSESTQKVNLSNDLLSVSWPSSSPSERSKTLKDDRVETSRKKYSKSHLKSLINLVRTRQVSKKLYC